MGEGQQPKDERIEEWNIEFSSKYSRTRPTLKTGSPVEDIPIVKNYKFLGSWIEGSLSLRPQLKHIEDKTRFLTFKLWFSA